jgi:hypothetical protein
LAEEEFFNMLSVKYQPHGHFLLAREEEGSGSVSRITIKSSMAEYAYIISLFIRQKRNSSTCRV